jgi:cellulose synthase/poly-beta-1,6-N-acetylglucosamine synthase-like glycosyltransferase
MRVFATETVFWAGVAAVIYSYVLYPLLLLVLASLKQMGRDLHFLLARKSRRSSSTEEFEPRVTLLVAAYNEEDVIEVKLRNTAQLDYPAEKFELLLGLDAPTDSTPEHAARVHHPSFRLFSFPTRRGKLAVIHDLAAQASGEILVFSDANTMLGLDCIRHLTRHFADPRVGAVCGELRLVGPDGETDLESLYWRYEVALKFLENRLDCVVGANGAIYAVRRSLFRQLDSSIIEDFQLLMEIRFAGHRVVYDPEAVGTEDTAPDLASEFRRRARIGAGDYQTLLNSPRFLNPLKGFPAFAYASHKAIRWLVPLLLPVLLVSNLLLARNQAYAVLLAGQGVFYLLAALGWFRVRRGNSAGLLGAPLYFLAMNVALLAGLFRYLTGAQRTVWSATSRRPQTLPESNGNSKEVISPAVPAPRRQA